LYLYRIWKTPPKVPILLLKTEFLTLSKDL
jgi:hypothetical protein